MKKFEKNIELLKELKNWWSSLENDKLPKDENTKEQAARGNA
jgi:hypothetical protein